MEVLKYIVSGEKIRALNPKVNDLETVIGQICKKLFNGKSINIIASEVEEDEEHVKEIASIAEKYLPDYDEEKIYEEWKNA